MSERAREREREREIERERERKRERERERERGHKRSPSVRLCLRKRGNERGKVARLKADRAQGEGNPRRRFQSVIYIQHGIVNGD